MPILLIFDEETPGSELLAYFTTGGLSNGPIEAINLDGGGQPDQLGNLRVAQ